jgi:hypothetical protein
VNYKNSLLLGKLLKLMTDNVVISDVDPLTHVVKS